MRSAANGHVKKAKVSRGVPDTSVRGSTSFDAETKSPIPVYRDRDLLMQKLSSNQPVNTYAWCKREVRYFEHKHPILVNPPQEQV